MGFDKIMSYDLLFDNNNFDLDERSIISMFELMNDDNFLKHISHHTLHKNSFLIFLLADKDKIKDLLISDSLLRFKFIDLFNNHIDLIENLKLNLNGFLNYKQKNMLNDIWILINNKYKKLNNEDITRIQNKYNDIMGFNENEEKYLNLLNFYFFIKGSVIVFDDGNNKFNNLAKRLLIMYYFEPIKDIKLSNIKIEEEDKNDFLNVLYKNNELFEYIEDENKIVWKGRANDIDRDNMSLPFDDIIIGYFYFLIIENNSINKNLIAWCYVLFYDKLSIDVLNDMLKIILDIKTEYLGIVVNILNTLNNEFSDINKIEFENLIKKSLEKYNYMMPLTNDLNLINDLNVSEITNNLFFLYNLKHNNNQIYSFFKNNIFDKLYAASLQDGMNLFNLTAIFDYNIIEMGFEEIINKINMDITKLASFWDKNDDGAFFTRVNSNSLLKDNEKKYFIVNNKLHKVNFNYENILRIQLKNDGILRLKYLSDNNLNLSINCDSDLLFYKMLLILSKFNLTLNFKYNINSLIKNYILDLNSIKKIYERIYNNKNFNITYKN